MSAVIYAAIVVMWAVVLVPMWLRRHDAATESRSVDRFSTAMRTLSRRTGSSPGRRSVVMPRRDEPSVSVHVSGAPAARRRLPRLPQLGGSLHRSGRASLVARRRRMLLGLLVVTFLTMVLAAAGVLSWPLQIVVDVILVAFCAHLRAQARRAAAVARQRRRAAVATRHVAAPDRAAHPMPASMAAPVAPVVPAAPVAPAAPAVPVAPPAATYAAAAAAAYDDDVDEDDGWEPVPVPRPTYTMKPPAPAYEADPTYAPPVYERREPLVSDVEITAEEDSDLEEILDRRWAVND